MIERVIAFLAALLIFSDPVAVDVKAVLAQRTGRIEIRGLQKPVEVLTDTWGVPHIYAENSADLFFAQGWVAASDRLWQMEMWRRAGEGRLAEVLGESAIERDRFARLLKYRGDMEAEWKSYAPDAREIIQSFVNGVNAYIAQATAANKLPVEFQMMGFRPEPWTPEACITRLAGYGLTSNASNEIIRAQVVAAVGAKRAAELMPLDPPTTIDVAPGLDLAGIDSRIMAGLRAASAAPMSRVGDGVDTDAGSNNWTVAGKRTTTGKPILANDPHRTIALPSLRYMAHLVAPGWNVIGSGEPALPGIAIGHNQRIAFGLTVFYVDQQDIYVEQMDPENPRRYKTSDGWELAREVTESVQVKGKAQPVDTKLMFTKHGPVIYEDHTAHRAYVLRWSGSEPGSAGYLASLSLDRATNWQEFRAALERWKLPAENFVYADIDGNIGMQSAALVPRRVNYNGLLPVPGSGNFDWRGFFTVDDLPHVLNPAEGFIATANNRTIPADEKRILGFDSWAPPDRITRINEVLRSKPKFSVEDMERLQLDEVSVPARQFVKMLPAFAPEMLRKWDGNLSRDSAAAALYEVTLRKLRPRVTATMGPASVMRLIQGRASLGLILAALANLPEGERRRIFTQSLDEAQTELRERLGPDPGSWHWGDLHKAAFTHPLSKEFDLASPARGGDGTTPNATSPDSEWRQTGGASYREIFDLGDWDRSRAINVPGQSGQPGSPHYGDLLPLWADGKYFPLLYSRAAVERAAREKLLLVPVY